MHYCFAFVQQLYNEEKDISVQGQNSMLHLDMQFYSTCRTGLLTLFLETTHTTILSQSSFLHLPVVV